MKNISRKTINQYTSIDVYTPGAVVHATNIHKVYS